MAVHVVTGGAGFIGSHIVEALIGAGDRVIVLDDFSSGRYDNLSGARTGLDVREVDLGREADLGAHFDGVDTVFHHAAIASVPRSLAEPLACHNANLTATLQVLEACREACVRRIVYASSSAVYGDLPDLPKHEGSRLDPVSPYGAQKYFGEVYARVFGRSFGLETVSLRYFNVFGPRQDASSPYSGVFARFIPVLLDGRAPTVYGDGEQSRDFVYVSDVVEANLRAGIAEGVSGRVINIASGQATTVNAVLEEARKLTGGQVPALSEPPRPGDILHSRADITEAGRILGWAPAVTLQEGLRRTIDWYREKAKDPA